MHQVCSVAAQERFAGRHVDGEELGHRAQQRDVLPDDASMSAVVAAPNVEGAARLRASQKFYLTDFFERYLNPCI